MQELPATCWDTWDTQVKCESSDGCSPIFNKTVFKPLFQSVKSEVKVRVFLISCTFFFCFSRIKEECLFLKLSCQTCVYIQSGKTFVLPCFKVFGGKPKLRKWSIRLSYKHLTIPCSYTLQLHIIETDEYVYFKMYIVNNYAEINSLAFDELL